MKILGMGVPELLIALVVIVIPVIVVAIVITRNRKKNNDFAIPFAGNVQGEAPTSACQPLPPEQACATGLAQAAQQIAPPACGAAPVLKTWKTSVGFSLLGALVGLPLAMMLMILLASFVSFGVASGVGAAASLAPELTSAVASALVTPIAAILFYVLSMVYATVFYPSYFGSKPKVKSSRVISFLNLVFGFVIFGALWNSALTKKSKGTSHVVLVVLTALMLVGMVVNVGATIAQGLASTPQAAHVEQQSGKGDTPEEKSAFVQERRNGYSFEMPSDWVEQQFYDGYASYGYEGYVALNIEEVDLGSATYPTADEQVQYLEKLIMEHSGSTGEGSAEYRFTNQEAYRLDDCAMVQAVMNVYENDALNAKHSVLFFFVSESEYVSMMFLSKPENFETSSALANRIFESVRLV